MKTTSGASEPHVPHYKSTEQEQANVPSSMDKEKQKNQPTRSLQEEHEKERHYGIYAFYHHYW